ncbi:MAG: alpha/beta fold hydrolase [Pseudomonadota bacterium]
MGDHRDIDVPLTRGLERFGGSVRVRVTGRDDAPLVIALGGISGNRFVCAHPDGRTGWWPGMVGAGCAVDPRHYRVLGIDFAADPLGKIAPSTSDQAQVVRAVLDRLAVDKAYGFVAASYGAMVALSFAERFPDRIGKLAIISAGARPHAAATALRELQRRVVALGLEVGREEQALAVARGMAMMSYRTPDEFGRRFRGGLTEPQCLGTSEPGAYLRARGEAFLSVMSPQRFLSLSASIDRHEVDATRIVSPVLLIGAKSDQLVPPDDMRQLASALAGPTELHLLDCLEGHDMFLTNAASLSKIVSPFLERPQ